MIAALLSLALLTGSAHAGTDTIHVDGQRVRVEAWPHLTIQVDDDLRFLGRESYILYGAANVIRLNFGHVVGGRIERLLVFQFEGYLPGNTYTYTPPDSGVTDLAGLPFGTAARAIDFEAFVTRWAGRGTEHERSRAFLAERDLALDAQTGYAWLGNIAEDRRRELIVMYFENLADLGVTPAAWDENGRADIPDDVAGPLFARALASFTMRGAGSLSEP